MRKKILKWFRAHKIEAAVAVIFGAIGYLAGFATHYELKPHLRFDDKIDPVALLSLACTVVLAWIVATILEKQKEAEKSAKEVLVKRAEDLHVFVTQISSIALAGSFSYAQAAALIKRVEVTINRLWQLIASVDIDCDITIKDAILVHVEKMDVLLTDLPIGAPSTNLPLRVENGLLRFSNDRALEVETAFEDLRDLITNLELAIIRG